MKQIKCLKLMKRKIFSEKKKKICSLCVRQKEPTLIRFSIHSHPRPTATECHSSSDHFSISIVSKQKKCRLISKNSTLECLPNKCWKIILCVCVCEFNAVNFSSFYIFQGISGQKLKSKSKKKILIFLPKIRLSCVEWLQN